MAVLMRWSRNIPPGSWNEEVVSESGLPGMLEMMWLWI